MAHSSHAELERLYRRYHREITGALARELGDWHEAEDVTQEAFLNAFRALERGNTPTHPRRWLHAIAVNANMRRHRRRRPAEVPLEHAEEPPAAEPEVATRELVDALAKLPPDQRAALLLHEVAGLSYADVAERLDRSEGSVQMLLFRARQRLRVAIGARALAFAPWQRLAQFLPSGDAPVAAVAGRALAAAAAAVVVGLGASGSTTDPASPRRDDAPAPPPARAAADRAPAGRARAERPVHTAAPVARPGRTRRAAAPGATTSSAAKTTPAAVEGDPPSVHAPTATTTLPVPAPSTDVPAISLPDAPKAPAAPAAPQLPATTAQLPATPQLPSTPQLPPTPQVPQLPPVTTPTATVTVPAVPGVPG